MDSVVSLGNVVDCDTAFVIIYIYISLIKALRSPEIKNKQTNNHHANTPAKPSIFQTSLTTEPIFLLTPTNILWSSLNQGIARKISEQREVLSQPHRVGPGQ